MHDTYTIDTYTNTLSHTHTDHKTHTHKNHKIILPILWAMHSNIFYPILSH